MGPRGAYIQLSLINEQCPGTCGKCVQLHIAFFSCVRLKCYVNPEHFLLAKNTRPTCVKLLVRWFSSVVSEGHIDEAIYI